MLLGKVRPENVEAREHPAAPAALLVGNALAGSLYGEMRVHGTLVGMVLGKVVNAVCCYGVEESLSRRIASLYFPDIIEHLLRDAPVSCLRPHIERNAHAES